MYSDEREDLRRVMLSLTGGGRRAMMASVTSRRRLLLSSSFVLAVLGFSAVVLLSITIAAIKRSELLMVRVFGSCVGMRS